MKSVHDNPIDPLGQIGKPIRPEPPKKPDPVREFEHIGDTSKALDTMAETLRKTGTPAPVIDDGQASDWEGLCMDPYGVALLGCI